MTLSATSGYLKKVPVAVFDFDGTVLDGQSSVSLVLELIRRRIMKVRSALPVAWWGVRYKLHLPHEQYEVRQKVFSHLARLTTEEVDALVEELYRDLLAPMMREQAIELIERYKAHGVKVFIVSASFEPIIARVADALGVEQISTRMEIKNGRYTAKLAGAPVEGTEKPLQFFARADELYGEDGWRLVAAYGDHHTDIPLLEEAEHAYAVDPDMMLHRAAVDNGWPELKWTKHLTSEQLDRVCPGRRSIFL